MPFRLSRLSSAAAVLAVGAAWNCQETGYKSYLNDWLGDRVGWCCEHEGKLCPTLTTTKTTSISSTRTTTTRTTSRTTSITSSSTFTRTRTSTTRTSSLTSSATQTSTSTQSTFATRATTAPPTAASTSMATDSVAPFQKRLDRMEHFMEGRFADDMAGDASAEGASTSSTLGAISGLTTASASSQAEAANLASYPDGLTWNRFQSVYANSVAGTTPKEQSVAYWNYKGIKEDCPTDWEPHVADLRKEYPELPRYMLLGALHKWGGHVGGAKHYLKQFQATPASTTATIELRGLERMERTSTPTTTTRPGSFLATAADTLASRVAATTTTAEEPTDPIYCAWNASPVQFCPGGQECPQCGSVGGVCECPKATPAPTEEPPPPPPLPLEQDEATSAPTEEPEVAALGGDRNPLSRGCQQLCWNTGGHKCRHYLSKVYLNKSAAVQVLLAVNPPGPCEASALLALSSCSEACGHCAEAGKHCGGPPASTAPAASASAHEAGMEQAAQAETERATEAAAEAAQVEAAQAEAAQAETERATEAAAEAAQGEAAQAEAAQVAKWTDDISGQTHTLAPAGPGTLRGRPTAPPPAAAQAAPPPPQVAPQEPPQENQLSGPCQRYCLSMGKLATCAERITSEANKNPTWGRVEACENAVDVVASTCPDECSGCGAEDASCAEAATKLMVMGSSAMAKKFRAAGRRWLPQFHSGAMGALGAALAASLVAAVVLASRTVRNSGAHTGSTATREGHNAHLHTPREQEVEYGSVAAGAPFGKCSYRSLGVVSVQP